MTQYHHHVERRDMSSSTKCSTTTIQYRLNLPSVLHSVSPALSSLHASRAAALHPEASALLHPSHCPKCGTYRFYGDHPTHLVDPPTRKRRRRAGPSHAKALQRRCHVCGFSVDAGAIDRSSFPVQLPSDSLNTKNAPSDPRPMGGGQEPPPTDVLRPVSTGSPVPATANPSVLPPPVREPQPKPSHKKSSTLKDMLSRDREREEVNTSKKNREGHEGLAAFLKEL